MCTLKIKTVNFYLKNTNALKSEGKKDPHDNIKMDRNIFNNEIVLNQSMEMVWY